MITVHQSVHGYNRGHSLLQGSIELSRSDSELVLDLSDLSGSDYVESAQSYVTGYPLSRDTYVVARTWYAREAPRPNTVWTHSFYISREAMKTVDFAELDKYFRRPSYDTLSEYRKPITLSSDDSDVLGASGLQEAWKLALLQRLYSHPGAPGVGVDWPVRKAEQFIWQISRRQWTSLRMNFSFCSAALTLRKLHGRFFDLQFVPEGVRSSLSGVSRKNVVYFRADDVKLPAGERASLITLWNEWDAGFGNFCKFYVDDEPSDRSSMIPLYQVFQHWNIWTGDAALTSLGTIAHVFPEADSAVVLKEHWLMAMLRSDGEDSRRLWHELLKPSRISDAFAAAAVSAVPPCSSFALDQQGKSFVYILDSGVSGLSSTTSAVLKAALQNIPLDWVTSGETPHLLAAWIVLKPEILESDLVAGAIRPDVIQYAYALPPDSKAQQAVLGALAVAVAGRPEAIIGSYSDATLVEGLAALFKDAPKGSASRENIGKAVARNASTVPHLLSVLSVKNDDDAELFGLVLANVTEDREHDAVMQSTLSSLLDRLFAIFAASYLSQSIISGKDPYILVLISRLLHHDSVNLVPSELWKLLISRIDAKAWIPEEHRTEWLAHAVRIVLKAEPKLRDITVRDPYLATAATNDEPSALTLWIRRVSKLMGG